MKFQNIVIVKHFFQLKNKNYTNTYKFKQNYYVTVKILKQSLLYVDLLSAIIRPQNFEISYFLLLQSSFSI